MTARHQVTAAALMMIVAACGARTVSPPSFPEASPTTSPTTPPPPTTAAPGTVPASGVTRAGDSTALLPAQEIPAALANLELVWNTDFTRATVDLDEILVGIPALDPRDLIRPIDQPVFESVAESTWLTDQDPGVVLEIAGDARFYPLAIMTRHEIVNDTVGGVGVAVTYCPLCNTAVVFDRRLDGELLRFGVSGLLRISDLVMWDDKTESLWQQVTGRGIVGTHAGDVLTPIGSAIARWADYKSTYVHGVTMAANQGLGITYGGNPYAGYSSRSGPYFFFRGAIDNRYPALSRVVGVTIGDQSKAYPFSEIQEVRAVNDVIDDQPIVVLWGAPDTADALDSARIAASVGIGTGIAFSSVVDGRILTFRAFSDTEFSDIETGTTWSILGLALDGRLAGQQLEMVPHRNEFWFAWQAFFPDAPVWTR